MKNIWLWLALQIIFAVIMTFYTYKEITASDPMQCASEGMIYCVIGLLVSYQTKKIIEEEKNNERRR